MKATKIIVSHSLEIRHSEGKGFVCASAEFELDEEDQEIPLRENFLIASAKVHESCLFQALAAGLITKEDFAKRNSLSTERHDGVLIACRRRRGARAAEQLKENTKES